MQTTYNANQAAGILGMLASSTMFKHTDSMIASEAIVPGRAVMRTPNYADQVQTTKATYATLVLSTALITSNSTIITVGGVSTAALVFASSNTNTMTAVILPAVIALSTVARAEIVSTETGDNRLTLRIWTTGAVNDAAGTTTLGSSSPSWTRTVSFEANDFFGLAQLTARLEAGLPNTDSDASYPAESLVNVLRRGRLYVNFVTAFDPDKDTLYVRHTAGTGYAIGDFANTSTNATSLSGLPIRVITHLTAAGIGVIEINLP